MLSIDNRSTETFFIISSTPGTVSLQEQGRKVSAPGDAPGNVPKWKERYFFLRMGGSCSQPGHCCCLLSLSLGCWAATVQMMDSSRVVKFCLSIAGLQEMKQGGASSWCRSTYVHSPKQLAAYPGTNLTGKHYSSSSLLMAALAVRAELILHTLAR